MTRTTTADFADLIEYVEEELDFSTSHYNDDYLDRRITARIRRTGADDYDEYFAILREEEPEHEALLDSLSINVTGFFRNPEMWESLRSVLRDLTDEQRRVRIWSAPCSDGREPYSIAMLALDDPQVDAGRIEITGTDISEDALAAAREGVYETTRTTDIAEELAPLDGYEEYIRRDGDCFEVRDPVRRPVTFEHHDLIQDNPPGSFDLVLSRNLIIYIAPEYKEAILDRIDDALVADGYLVIGMTEALPTAYRSLFTSVDKSTRIYRRADEGG